VRTIFQLKKETNPVLRTLSEQVSAKVKYPITVSHYNLEAKIYKGKDGYHAIWYADGKRKKRQFKKLKDAKEAALKALKLIHKGQGARKSFCPNCSPHPRHLATVTCSVDAPPPISRVIPTPYSLVTV